MLAGNRRGFRPRPILRQIQRRGPTRTERTGPLVSARLALAKAHSSDERWDALVGRMAAGPLAEATSTETVLLGGAALTAAVLAIGLLPRETRMLRRAEHAGSGPAV